MQDVEETVAVLLVGVVEIVGEDVMVDTLLVVDVLLVVADVLDVVEVGGAQLITAGFWPL